MRRDKARDTIAHARDQQDAAMSLIVGNVSALTADRYEGGDADEIEARWFQSTRGSVLMAVWARAIAGSYNDAKLYRDWMLASLAEQQRKSTIHIREVGPAQEGWAQGDVYAIDAESRFTGFDAAEGGGIPTVASLPGGFNGNA